MRHHPYLSVRVLCARPHRPYAAAMPGDDVAAPGLPTLTRREQEVLDELTRPLGGDAPFTEPASVKDIAGRLFVTQAAVKQHLLRLYDKFEIWEGEPRRRLKLANEAMRRRPPGRCPS